MARIQIEYTANVTNLQQGLNKIIQLNQQVANSAKQAATAVNNISASLKGAASNAQRMSAQTRSSFNAVQSSSAAATRQVAQLNAAMRSASANANSLSASMSRMATSMSGAFNAASKSSNQLSLGLGGLRTLVAQAFAVGTVLNFGKAVVNVTAQIELLQSRLSFIYGGIQPGSAAFTRLSNTIRTLGLEFESTMEQATSFSIASQQAGYTTDQTEKMFISFASALRAAGSSSLQVQRSFYALQQMMSKGVVSAEELNRQMGESLPGAAMLMFKAFKNLHPELVNSFEDFRKLQKEGKILSAEVLPEFIRVVEEEFAPALAGKQNSVSANLNRLSQSWTEFKLALSDTKAIKETTSVLTDMLNSWTSIISSKNLSFFEKLLSFTNPDALQVYAKIASNEQDMNLRTANKIQEDVAKINIENAKLSNEEKKKALEILEKEIAAYEKYLKLIAEREELFKIMGHPEPLKEATNTLSKFKPDSLIGTALSGMKTGEITKNLLPVAQQVARDLKASIAASAGGSITDDEATGKKEDPRLKALQDEIAAQKALVLQEEERIAIFNKDAQNKIKTSGTLVVLNEKLAELKEKLDNLESPEKGARQLAAAEKELSITKENIALEEQTTDLVKKQLIERLEAEKDAISKRRAQTKEGSVDEMNLLMELMDKEVEIEIAKNDLVGDARDKVIQENLKNQKKMLSDSAKNLEEFKKKVSEAIQAPFLDETQLKRASIISEYEELIYEVKNQFDLGKISAQEFSDAVKGLNDAMQKALEDVGGDSKNLFGLSDEQLRQIKDALNIVGNAFKDLYDVRMELARRANEAELEMLDKRFNAGLMRENEYNEKVAEVKKRQALAERDAAKFGIVLNTAQGVANVWSKFGAVPPVAAALTALLLGVSAAQLNAVNSAPLPTFHEGGLDIRKNSKKKPDNGLKSDEFYAKLQEGESVMTREETRKYKDVLKAIREDAMPIELMKAYKLPAYPRSIDKPSLMASNNTSLELAYQNAELVDAVKRNGAVTIRNANDIAEAIVSKSSFMKIANRRRIK